MADQARGYPLLSNLAQKDPQVAEFARLVWDNIYRLGDSINESQADSVEILAAVTALQDTQATFRKGSKVLATASGLTGFVVIGGKDGQVLTLQSNSPPVATFRSMGSLQLAASKLDDLSNVVVPSPVSGDLLQFDGTNWVNVARGFTERGRVTHSANQSIADATDVILAFDTERFDPGSMHDTVTNNSRVTVGSTQAGDYLIGVNISYTANTTGSRRVRILKNATTVLASVTAGGTGFSGKLAVTVLEALVATDFIEVDVRQSSTIALNVEKIADSSPELWWTRVA